MTSGISLYSPESLCDLVLLNIKFQAESLRILPVLLYLLHISFVSQLAGIK